jgi:endonuclease YncB( thermonuclease family)
MMRWLALLALIALPALAETWSGSAHVVDGDTLYFDQTIDAFESGQTCTRDGRAYPCGEESTRALLSLIGHRRFGAKGTSGTATGDPSSAAGSATLI